MQDTKRLISILIPFRRSDKGFLVFLQKRSRAAARLPGFFGFFGGGAENGEKPEEALRREIREELSFTPNGYGCLGEFEFPQSKKFIYYLEVDDRFEDQIEVKEGEYGRFFKEEESLREPNLIDEDKVVLEALFTKLHNAR